jgi:hypothetical protein
MTTQKDRIEAAIRHIQTATDVDPWAMEFAVEALKAQIATDTNVGSNDLISRQTLQNELALYLIDDVTSEDEAGYNRAINDIQKMVLHLPSAQPEPIKVSVDREMTEEELKELKKKIADSPVVLLPSAQPERTCVNCGRTANNGGWYADGRTRCPIEEHYALPKDGYCYLWEKKKVWEDDYVKRPEEGEK